MVIIKDPLEHPKTAPECLYEAPGGCSCELVREGDMNPLEGLVGHLYFTCSLSNASATGLIFAVPGSEKSGFPKILVIFLTASCGR